MALISANYQLDAAHIGFRQNDPRIKSKNKIKKTKTKKKFTYLQRYIAS